jgi:3-oxoacyl-(acyl-carrier-protein) synthase
VLTQHGLLADSSAADEGSSSISSGSGVLAYLHGTAVNQDGRSSSLTAPNGPSQQLLVGAALAAGRLAPSDVGLLAVHGTGGCWFGGCCLLLSGC